MMIKIMIGNNQENHDLCWSRRPGPWLVMQEQPTLCNKATFGADVPKVVVVQKHKLILLAASFGYMTCVQEATFSMQKCWCKIIVLSFHFLRLRHCVCKDHFHFHLGLNWRLSSQFSFNRLCLRSRESILI